MKSSNVDVKDVATSNEGAVVGAFFLTTEPVAENDKGWFFKPAASDQSIYTFSFRSTNDSFAEHLVSGFKMRYTLDVKAGQEEFFVRRLPAGKYEFTDLYPRSGILSTGVKIPFSKQFTVTPGKATYLGNYEIQLPSRLSVGASFTTNVKNKIDLVKSKLAENYPDLVQLIEVDPSINH